MLAANDPEPVPPVAVAAPPPPIVKPQAEDLDPVIKQAYEFVSRSELSPRGRRADALLQLGGSPSESGIDLTSLGSKPWYLDTGAL